MLIHGALVEDRRPVTRRRYTFRWLLKGSLLALLSDLLGGGGV